MKVSSLSVEAFRNLEPLKLSPDGGVNVIYGENAQGKTNLIELLWLFTGARSFRGAREQEMVPHEGTYVRASLEFAAAGRENCAELTLGAKRTAALNGVSLDSRSELAGRFCAVIFFPAQLSMIAGAPPERRRVVDTMICQLRPRYLQLLVTYNRALAQRNALLRDVRGGPVDAAALEMWDIPLAKTGARIVRLRRSYLDRLRAIARQSYDELSKGREELDVVYRVSGKGGMEEEEAFLIALRESLPLDLRRGFTTVGPHRDDVEFLLDQKPARLYASQGQQRSAVLAFKLGECAMVEQTLGEGPVLLLDDVMSELDASRRDFLLRRLPGRQVFITCCDPRQVEGEHASFEVRQGRLQERG